MLTAATLGLAGYGLYAIGSALFDIVFASRLELWANLIVGGLGVALLFSAVLVRVRLPGGLFFALGSLLGLQAISLHNSAHLHGSIQAVAEGVRAVFGGVLMALAWFGGRAEAARERQKWQAPPPAGGAGEDGIGGEPA